MLAENERLVMKLKSTNHHRDTNYKTLDLIDLIKYPTWLFIGLLNQYIRVIKHDFFHWPKTLYHTKVYEIKTDTEYLITTEQKV